MEQKMVRQGYELSKLALPTGRKARNFFLNNFGFVKGGKIALCVIGVHAAFFCSAQKDVMYNNQQWLQYVNQWKLSEKKMMYTDVSFRRINELKDWSQITFRTGLGYDVKEKLQGVTGVACFTFYTKNKLSRIELRPYQELNTTQTFGKVSVQHRLRVEARYFRHVKDGEVTSEDNFNWRFRYRIFTSTPVVKLSATNEDCLLLLNVGDEVFINAGNEITYNLFDNNRLLVGVTCQCNKTLSFSAAYINQFGQRAAAGTYENSDILTLGITQKMGK
jgi:hypothetical protein